MGIIKTIRKKGNLLVAFIAIALFFFVASQGIYSLVPLLSGTKNKYYIGEIANQKITFQTYDAIFNRFKSDYLKNEKQSDNEKEMHEIVWNYFVQEMIEKYMFRNEYDKLGLFVSKEELIDIVQGDHIHDYIKKIFHNKETNQFDISLLLDYLQLLPNKSFKEQKEWESVEKKLVDLRYSEKLISLMSESIYLTDLDLDDEAKFEYSSLNLKSLYIPYSAILDSSIVITNDMIKQYLNENEKKFKTKANLDVSFVEFPIIPSEEDKLKLDEEMNHLIQLFKMANNDLDFAQNNTDGSEANTHETYTLKQFTEKFPSVKRWTQNLIIGPIKISENNFKIYKLYKKSFVKDKNQRKPIYEIAVIEKFLLPSDYTKDKIFKKADYFSNNVLKSKFSEEAVKNNLEIQKIYKIKEEDYGLSHLKNARNLIKWAFSKENKDKVSPVFEIENKYIVAIVTKYKKEGLPEIEDVKDEISKLLIKKQKSDLILQKLSSMEKKNLSDYKNVYKDSKFIDIKNLKFKDEYIEGIGKVKKAVAMAFTLKNEGDETKPFSDEDGIIILKLLNKLNSAPEKKELHRRIDVNAETVMEGYNVFLALKDKSKIKNNIYKFY